MDKQNIMLNKPSTISPIHDEEMWHACSSSGDNNSRDECQWIFNWMLLQVVSIGIFGYEN